MSWSRTLWPPFPYLVFNCFAVTLQAVWALRGISHLSPCMALQGPFSAPNSNITFWWCLASLGTGNLCLVTTWQTSTPPCQKIKISIRKTSTSALLTMPKSLTVWITTNRGQFFKRWEYQTTWPASWQICMQVKKQEVELDMEQQTGSK